MLKPTAADNGGDLPLLSKPVGLCAQCDEEGSGASLSTGELVVVNTSRKRWGSRVVQRSVQRLKRARRLPSSDVSDRGSCPVWCRDDTSLPARVQQGHRCGHVIWENPSHMLLGTACCGPCRRAGVDQCFMLQAHPACARCTSLHNPHGQCTVEPSTITALTSGRSGVVVPRTHVYGGRRGGGTL